MASARRHNALAPLALLLAAIAWLALATAPAAAQVEACPTAPGAARAACFCSYQTVYRYYADTVNGCTGAMWCYGPGQSSYVTCQTGLLFNEVAVACDWPANVACSAASSTPSPSPAPVAAVPSPSPAAKASPALAAASPSPKPATASPSPKPATASPSPKPATASPSPKPATASPSPKPATPSPSPRPAASGNKTLPVGPIMSVYYESWSAGWASSGASMDLAKLPSYVNVINLAFAKPDCAYVKGSLSLAGTGLDFSSDGAVVKAAIATLKAANPNTRVMLAVGGATYTNFAGLNTQCIKDLVDDLGCDGADLDYEPTDPACTVGSVGVTCTTDPESVKVTAALRAALPVGQYLLSTASWHVGCYGVGTFKASQPASQYTGVNLAMATSPAGQLLDLINVMAYDAGNVASTGFDWSEAYRAHRAVWKTQAIAIGVEIPPEAWGGNVLTLSQVTTRANYARDSAGGAQFGVMLWSLHKTGCPNAQQITSSVCVAYGLGGCSTPLPLSQANCPTA